MSMKFFTGLQDFLGLYDPSVAPSIANTSPTSHIVSLFGTAANSRSSQQQQQRKRSPSTINKEELGDERISRCSHNRNVHFPEDDSQLVSGYHEAPTNSFHLKQCCDATVIAEAYCNACKLAKITPNATVEHQIACFHQVVGLRQECLSLKGQRLSQAHMECLEEIFRRVQFDTLDFEYTFIDDDAAVSLAEMLEFYDSTAKLNLSFNKQINIRGWQALFRAIKNCQSLQLLNLRYTSLSERAIPVLARTLRTQPTLTTLHLENVSLSGKNLLLLVCALKTNTVLKELYLGENNLQPADGAHLYQLIVGNTSIQMLDLRNNQLQDGGLRHLCDALRNKETLERSALSALVLWNNALTSSSMDSLASALMENSKLETLNIGSNNLSVEGIMALKPALLANSSLQRLGLQATNLDCQCAIVLAECLADNNVMVRVDLRDNAQIGSAGLLALHLAMKMNTSITLLNLDNSCAQSNSAKVKEYNEQFKLYFDEIKSFCERNKQTALKKLSVQSSISENAADSDSSEDGQAECSSDKQEEVVEERGEKESERKAESDGSEVKQRTVATMSKQKSVDIASHSKRPVWRFNRSSSLTCTELVEDINERILQMSRSCSTLDKAGGDESVSAPMPQNTSAGVAVPVPSKAEIAKSPSLPALPLLANAADSTATIKKPNRRFSVSLSTHSASNPDLRRPISPRFKVMPVTASSTHTLTQRTPSPPTLSSMVLEKKNTVKQAGANVAPSKPPETNVVTSVAAHSLAKNPSCDAEIISVSSKNARQNGNSNPLSDGATSDGTFDIVKGESRADGDIVPEVTANENLSGLMSYHPSAKPSQKTDLGHDVGHSSTTLLPISSKESENPGGEQKNAGNSVKLETVVECARATGEFSKKVEADDDAHQVAELSAKPQRFVELSIMETPSETFMESRCVSGGCGSHDMRKFSAQRSLNVDDSASVVENSQSGTDLSGVFIDTKASQFVPMSSSREDASDKNGALDGTSSVIDVPSTATVQTALEASETIGSGSPNNISASSSHTVSSFTNTQSFQEYDQPIITGSSKVSTSENEIEYQDRSGIGDADEFVFVVKENSREKLPDGCNIEVVSQSEPSSELAAAISQFPEPSIKLTTATECESSKLAEQMTCTGDGMQEEAVGEIPATQVDNPRTVDAQFPFKKPSDAELDVLCDNEVLPVTRPQACPALDVLEQDDSKREFSEAKELKLFFDRPSEVGRIECALPAINVDRAGGVWRVPTGIRKVEGELKENPRPKRPVEGALHLNADASDEEVVRRVVKDLVNFTSFEMGDEDGFHCSGSKSPSPSRLASPMVASRVTGFSPPRNLAPEMCGCNKEESDEQIVRSVVRALVRDVLLREKNALSRSLRKKRERLGNKEILSPNLS